MRRFRGRRLQAHVSALLAATTVLVGCGVTVAGQALPVDTPSISPPTTVVDEPRTTSGVEPSGIDATATSTPSTEATGSGSPPTTDPPITVTVTSTADRSSTAPSPLPLTSSDRPEPSTPPVPVPPRDPGPAEYEEPPGVPKIAPAPRQLPDPEDYFELSEMVATVDVTDFLQELTDNLQAGDDEAFLSHFGGEAHQRAWFWLKNLRALGMETGAVGTYGNGWNNVPVDDEGNGVLFYVQAGGHLPGDAVDDDGLPVISTSTYFWHIATTPEYPEPYVTGWTSIDRTPWDCLCSLHVSTTAAGSVAAYPDEAELADSQVEGLTAAVDWTRTYLDDVVPDLELGGPVVSFTSAVPARWQSWFQSIATSEGHLPAGMELAAFVAAVEPYDGPDADVSVMSDGYGSRMVLGAEATFDESIVVHELVHYYVNRFQDRNSSFISDNPAVAEGLARMVEQVQWSTSADQVERGEWVIELAGNWRDDWTREEFAERFADEVPDADQMRGPDSWFWYQVASTMFSYVATTQTMDAAVRAGVCAYEYGVEVFACVANPAAEEPGGGEPGDETYLDADDVRAGWVDWVHDTYL